MYPALQPGVELHVTAAEAMVLIPLTSRERRDGTEFVSHQPFTADGYLVEFLAQLDGVTPVEKAMERVSERYGPLFGPGLAKEAADWAATHQNFVEWFDDPLAAPRRPRLTGRDDAFYPLHSTFEIIETCNFTCDHCYYRSSPYKKGRISLDEAIRVMDTLAAHGVRVIELTGGECTIHPDFLPILRHAAQTFDLVAVISNGYRLGTDERLGEAVCGFSNVVAQISIDAIAERHDRFRKHNGSFEAAVKAVKRFVAAGVVTRISSSISEDNVDQVVPLYLLGRELGAPRHTFAPIAGIGRGCNITDPGAGAIRLVRAIEAALAPFADDPGIKALADIPEAADDYEPAHNCGAGWKTVAIDYNADIRVCNFSRDSKKLGNLLSDSYDLLFGQRAPFLFHNAPSPGGRDCDGCRYYSYCVGCFVKAFMLSETEYPECPWRRRWFPGMSLALDSDRASKSSREEKLRALPAFAPVDGAHVCGGCRARAPT
jgi:radical SAM protein with 4Fe4S-binding SPASM domain